MEDQAGTTHEYFYDGVGHLLADSISAFGAHVDQTVQSIRYAYKVCGRLLSVSSCASPYDPSNPTSGDVLNEVYYQYDSNGNLEDEYQEHDGAVRHGHQRVRGLRLRRFHRPTDDMTASTPASGPRRCNTRPPVRIPAAF